MKRNVAKEFRNEYYASLHYPEHIAELKLKLEELDASMGYHSPVWDKLHYAPVEHDTRLSEYVTRRSRITDDIERMERQIKRIQGILSLVDDPVKTMFIESYQPGNTVDSVAEKYGYDPSWARRLIDHRLRKAVQMYEDLGYLENEKTRL